MAQFDFSKFGQCMTFKTKLSRYIGSGNVERCKDYFVAAFDNVDPTSKRSSHPAQEVLEEAAALLKSNGWTIRVADWKDRGKQMIVTSPSGDCYVSRFQH